MKIPAMIAFDEALAAVLARVPLLQREKVALPDALGRILARPVTARLDMPRYDQSAMDGYAVRRTDTVGARKKRPVALRLVGELPAGSAHRMTLKAGTAVKIFTGSRLPAGTDAVVMKEYCREEGDRVLIELAAAPGEHIRRRAEEFRRGDPLLPAGTRITPPVVGLLANFGHCTVAVHRRPAVGIVTIGDELAAPGERLAAGRIYNSNEPALLASLQELGLARVATRVVRDDPAALRRALRALLARSDVVITAGGASVGDHDHVQAEALRAGVREVFRRVAVKPGKPTYFGTVPGRRLGTGGSRHRLFFGLPGNPVSALVCFQLFVRPALLRMMGLAEDAVPTLRAELAAECRKAPDRLEWLRGRLEPAAGGLRVVPSKRQGSHMLGGLAEADCLIRFPRAATRLAAGQEVEVRLLPW